jgi:hypothetical protein
LWSNPSWGNTDARFFSAFNGFVDIHIKKHTFTVLHILDYFDFYALFRTIIFEIYAKLRHYGLGKEIRRKLWEQFHNANWRMEQYVFVLKLE